MSEHVLSILVKAVGTAQAARNLKGIDQAVSNIGAHAGKGLRTAASNLARMGTIAAGVGAAGIVASVKAAADFEAAMNTVNTVAQETGTAFEGNLGKIGDSIRSLARSTGTPLDDLTAAYYDLVSAGIDTANAQDVLTQANKLAIGGLSTTAESVDLLTTAINSYGGDAKQAATFTNMFAEAIGAGKVTASELAASFATVGPIAADFGVGVDQISAALGIMTAKGTPAAQAFTQIRAAIVALKKPNAEMVRLQKQTGLDFERIAKKNGLAAAYQAMAKEAKKAGIPIEKLTGRIEGAQFAAQVTGDNFAAYNAELEKVRKSSEGAGVAQEQMDKRTQGLNYNLDRLKALARDAGITIGTALLPKITGLAEKAVTFLDTHQSDIKAFGDKIAGAFDKALEFAQRVPWGAIGDGLGAAADFAGKLMDAFASMPPGVQSTLIALAGLDKLSGGAIHNIVGELGKGLVKGVLGINAGVVNVRGAVVNSVGGLGGAGTAAGAAGASTGVMGKASGVIGTATKIVLPLAAGLAISEGIKSASGQSEAEWKATYEAGLKRLGGFGPDAFRPVVDKQNVTNIGITDLSKTQLSALGEQRDTRTAIEIGTWKQADAARGAGMMGAAATTMSAYHIVSAIQSSRPITNVNTVVTVTAANVQKSVNTHSTYGKYGGSAVGAHNGRGILD